MRNETSLNEEILTQEALCSFYTQYENKTDAKKRMKELLRKAVQQELTDPQRECIRLYYFEEKSVNEIAKIRGIRPTTVYKHLKKGRNALRRCTIYF